MICNKTTIIYIYNYIYKISSSYFKGQHGSTNLNASELHIQNHPNYPACDQAPACPFGQHVIATPSHKAARNEDTQGLDAVWRQHGTAVSCGFQVPRQVPCFVSGSRWSKNVKNHGLSGRGPITSLRSDQCDHHRRSPVVSQWIDITIRTLALLIMGNH